MIDKILIVGQGSIGNRHTEISRMIFPNADIRVLTKTKSSKISKYANSSIADRSEVKIFKPQIAIICNPSSMHIDIATYLAKHDVNLLIEKPLSSTLEGLDAFIKVVKKRKTKVLIGYNLRYKESLVKFKDIINSGSIGKILSVDCEAGQFLPDWRENFDYKKSVSAQRALGGGVLLELSHEIDYIRWIFGEIDWVSALLSKQSNLDIDVEDYANLTIGLKDSSAIVNLKLDFYRRDLSRKCIIHGEEGSLQWDAISGLVHRFDITHNKWEQVFKEIDINSNQTYMNEWNHFIDCIENKKEPSVSIEDGIRVLRVIEASRLSSKKNSLRVFVN
jgi:predicted dehydrogenase